MNPDDIRPHQPPMPVSGEVCWARATGFLNWSPQVDAADHTYYLAQVDLAEMDVVARDTSGETWGVTINGDVLADEYPSALSAQIAAMGLVLSELAEMVGDAARSATTDQQERVRAVLEEIHSMTRDSASLSQRARERLWPYCEPTEDAEAQENSDE